MKEFYVYITTNPARTVLYTGVTNDLQRRLIEHFNNRGNTDTFTGKYYCYNLIYYDCFPSSHEAIQAEKFIKGKSREKKEVIIEAMNPTMAFLNSKVCGTWPPK